MNRKLGLGATLLAGLLLLAAGCGGERLAPTETGGKPALATSPVATSLAAPVLPAPTSGADIPVGHGQAGMPAPPTRTASAIFDGAAEPRNVILVSWDGLDRSVLRELLAQDRLPNLAALINEGSLRPIDVVGHVTVTKPGHAEMLTGLDVAATGVYTNGRYRPIPEGLTILERLREKLGPEQVHVFMVTSKVAHVGGRGPGEIQPKVGKGRKKRPAAGATPVAPPGADDDPAVEKQGEPFFLTKRRLDVFDSAQRTAEVTGPLCLNYLAQYKSPRCCAFLHFSDPDHAGHAHGAASAEYRQAAVDDDAWLGRIVAWLREQELYETTLLYVMTDHGFDMPNGFGHSRAPDSWLATNDRTVARGGIIADVPATILKRFGFEVAKLEPKLLGVPLSEPAPTGRPAAPVVAPRKGGKAGKGAGKGGRAGKRAAPTPSPSATFK